MKITRFDDIPQFTRPGIWQADYDLVGAWQAVSKWTIPEGKMSGLDLNPDFQRAHVWTEAQQVAWLEFFLRGGKSGRVIYFNHPGWMRSWTGDFVIVDGKQRMEAIRRFLHDEVSVFGSHFSEFTDSVRFVSTTIQLHVNNLATRAEVLRWYLEFNAGGTPHTEAEIHRVRELLKQEVSQPPEAARGSEGK